MSGYLNLTCSASESLEDELPEILATFSVLGCHVDPGVEAGRVLFHVFFESDHHYEALSLAQVLEKRGASDVRLEEAPQEDWLAEYRKGLQPLEIGNLWWLDPHPETPTPAPQGRVRITIEPRMAFGTGSHETTQLIMLELEGRRLDGASVLDVGTGSGILGLASIARGASWVAGHDNDPQAIFVAREIARQQDLELTPSYLVSTAACFASKTFDLVLCNMISEHFLPMLPDLSRVMKDHGEIVLSGILNTQKASIVSELRKVGLEVSREDSLNEWVCLVAS
jgi:ribosomal protein L11 methyltransferase